MGSIGQRYKDVLLALTVAHEYHQPLGRLQLQKYIYLADVLSAIWEVMAPKAGHYIYRNGPYDPSIQNAADVLAFRGMVSISMQSLSAKRIIANYTITDLGLKLTHKLLDELPFSKRYGLYTAIGYHINQHGWDKLMEIVYSEATYLANREEGWNRLINTSSLLSNESLRIVVQFQDFIQKYSGVTSRENLVAIFFRVIDNYTEIVQGLSYKEI